MSDEADDGGSRDDVLDILRRTIGRVLAGDTIGVLIVEIHDDRPVPSTSWSFPDGALAAASLGARVLDAEVLDLARAAAESEPEPNVEEA